MDPLQGEQTQGLFHIHLSPDGGLFVAWNLYLHVLVSCQELLSGHRQNHWGDPYAELLNPLIYSWRNKEVKDVEVNEPTVWISAGGFVRSLLTHPKGKEFSLSKQLKSKL